MLSMICVQERGGQYEHTVPDGKHSTDDFKVVGTSVPAASAADDRGEQGRERLGIADKRLTSGLVGRVECQFCDHRCAVEADVVAPRGEHRR